MPKWFTGEIKHHINKLRHLRRKHTKKPSSQSTSRLAEFETDLQEKIIKARSTWESQLVNDFAGGNTHRIFSHIKSLFKHSSYPTPMSIDSKLVHTSQEKADMFNQYFHSVLSDACLKPCTSTQSEQKEHSIDIIFDTSDTFRALASLDTTKAMGPDKFSPKMLKSCACAICEPINHLFSVNFAESKLPAEWKTHLIIPIHKSGQKSAIANYRPISLLCTISKVLERLIYDQIIDFLSNNIINTTQFGFLKGKSTCQQLLIFLSDIMSATQAKGHLDAVYLDFRKAFDSVSLTTASWSS